jgi:hypothetical protein
MIDIKSRQFETLKWRPKQDDTLGTPAGLTRTNKIIRTQHLTEVQFQKLCSQIRLDDCKRERAEKQRNDRISKRKQ